jgi:hypothetical protein
MLLFLSCRKTHVCPLKMSLTTAATNVSCFYLLRMMQCIKIKHRILTLVRLWQAFPPAFSFHGCFLVSNFIRPDKKCSKMNVVICVPLPPSQPVTRVAIFLIVIRLGHNVQFQQPLSTVKNVLQKSEVLCIEHIAN